MRLTQAQIHSIIVGLTPFIHGAGAELYVFGSRLHDHLDSNDIELLIMTEQTGLAENLIQLKNILITNMKKYIGDHPIDLRIYAKEDIGQDASLKEILPTAISLHHW